MPASTIENPGRLMGLDYGVASWLLPVRDVFANRSVGNSCFAAKTPIGNHLNFLQHAVRQAAQCLVESKSPVLWVDFSVRSSRASLYGFVSTLPARSEHVDDLGRHYREHRKYLDGLEASEIISTAMFDRAMKNWHDLWNACPDLAVPDAGPGPDGDLLYIWQHEEHYLSLAMLQDGPSEFFHKDLKTGSIWGLDYCDDGSDISDELLAKLKLFRHCSHQLA